MNSRKKILVVLSTIVLSFIMVCTIDIKTFACETVTVSDSNPTGVATPRSAIIEWRYKIEDGKLYRRQYNYTEQCWVGDWIWCP